MLGYLSDMQISVEAVPILRPGPGLLALVVHYLAGPSPHSRFVPHLEFQNLYQSLQVLYLSGCCIYAGRVGDWVGG
jgi:hypothetical protein